MKRRDLVRALVKAGYVLARSTGKHDWYVRGKGDAIPVPRHREIKEPLARAILRQAGVET